MTPIVSVILTSYNKTNTVGLAIESIIKQTLQNWELFIMDDNSNDDTVKVIKQYLNDPRIKYYNSNIQDQDRFKSTRYATLINEAIPKCQGKYITYLTDDNMYLPERLAMMVNYLQQNPNIHIVYSQQLVKSLDEASGVQSEVVRRTYGVLRNAAGLVDHCSVMHTRKIADHIFNEHGSHWDDNPNYWNYGDAVFWNRLTKYQYFYPIRKVLDIALKGEDSFQRLYSYLPKTIPNGTLIRGLNNDVFLLENQTRRKIHSQAFEDLKFNSNLVVRIPDPFLYKYNEGIPIDHRVFDNFSIFPNLRLIKSKNHHSIFYIQNHQKHHIISYKAFNDYKFNSECIVLVSDSLLEQIPEGKPIEELSPSVPLLPDGVLYKIQKTFYISFDNSLHQIDEKVVKKLNLPITDPVKIDYRYLKSFKLGEPFVWIS